MTFHFDLDEKTNPKHIRIVNCPEDWGLKNNTVRETFQSDVECETCQVLGAYTIDGDNNSVGVCMKHLIRFYGKENIKEVKN